MRQKYPGFLLNLQNQLESLSQEDLDRASKFGGLDIQDLITLVLNPKDYTVDTPENVKRSDVVIHDELSIDLARQGESLLKDNSVAFCILAGGAGTRIGRPKCLLEIPGTTDTLITHKLKQSMHIKNVWIMVSHDLVDVVKQHLTSKNLMRDGIEIIEQYESIRLTPDNQISLTVDGKPNFYPCGHGDVVPALQHSGLISKFLSVGGKYIYVSNVDNVLAYPDEKIVGLHHNNKASVTCEVVKRNPEDKGGFLCVHEGVNQIVESFRMSYETDLEQFEWLNTNTMIFNANLPFEGIHWFWHRVKKNVNNQLVIQHERLLQQLTEVFQTQFVEVNRKDRFMPIKSASDLDKIK